MSLCVCKCICRIRVSDLWLLDAAQNEIAGIARDLEHKTLAVGGVPYTNLCPLSALDHPL